MNERIDAGNIRSTLPLLALVFILGCTEFGIATLSSASPANVLAQASYAANAEALDAECTAAFSYSCEYPSYDAKAAKPCGLGRKVASSEVQGHCVAQNKAETDCVVTALGQCVAPQEASGSNSSQSPTIGSSRPSLLSPDSFMNQGSFVFSPSDSANLYNPQPIQDQGPSTNAPTDTGESQTMSGSDYSPDGIPTTSDLSHKIDNEIMQTQLSMEGDITPLQKGLDDQANQYLMDRYYSTDTIPPATRATADYQDIQAITNNFGATTFPNQIANQTDLLSPTSIGEQNSSGSSNPANDVIDLRDAPLTYADFPHQPIFFTDQSVYYNQFYDSVGYPTASFMSKVGTEISSGYANLSHSISAFFGR